MNRFRLGFILLLSVGTSVAVLPILPTYAQQRGFQQPAGTSQTESANGKYYALVIGIDQYHPPMQQLRTPVNDAKAIGKLLHDQYGFEVRFLLDQEIGRASCRERV